MGSEPKSLVLWVLVSKEAESQITLLGSRAVRGISEDAVERGIGAGVGEASAVGGTVHRRPEGWISQANLRVKGVSGEEAAEIQRSPPGSSSRWPLDSGGAVARPVPSRTLALSKGTDQGAYCWLVGLEEGRGAARSSKDSGVKTAEWLKMVDYLANTEINSQRIAAVESCFGASGQPLALPGRVLLGEGVLTKECRKKAKPRIFFLFNDILVYGSIVLNKRKYRSQHIIPLEEVTLETLPETLQAKNRWMIKTAKKSFVVSAASATERQEWISHIEECVRRQLLATGLQPSTEHAAPWIPDKATDICMRCTQTRFSALTRRHHCRKCGFVVCAECSRERFLLPRLSPKPLRVCSLCFRELAAQKRKEDVEEQGLGSPGPSAYLAGAVCGASSGDDDDSDEDREGSGDGDWPSHVEFYASGVSWSSFHS
ncbi:hypothetical protein AB1E18_013217 [Capra hircus]